MKDTAEVVKAALDETDRAQSIAMDAIELAQNNTKGTMDLLNAVRLTSVMMRFDSVYCFGMTKTAQSSRDGVVRCCHFRTVCLVFSNN